GSEIHLEPTDHGAYPAFYAGVERAIRGAGPPPVRVADAVAYLEVIEAVHRLASP
ncbi:MAG: oxidoreductase, partial [Gemmatimonadaceae bacterium]|nr:oxidoreductase [Gemmatimonadaceae bacterium]